MTGFSEKSLLALGECYVYGLVNPLTNKLFYIGKGTRNRVFDHELEALGSEDQEALKLNVIREIKAMGKEVRKVIFAYGLNTDEAIAAEAALINAFRLFGDAELTNLASGHHCHTAYTVEEFEREFAAEPLTAEDVKHNLVIIKINRLYQRNMTPLELYNCTRGVWRMSRARAEASDYVLAVYHSLVVGVYKPDRWYSCGEAAERLKEFRDIDLTSEAVKRRLFFEDSNYDDVDEVKGIYLGRTIKHLGYNDKAQNPITYISREIK